jgi:Insulinase (Peptidase family M16)
VEEAEDEQGLAHVVEHVTFLGSKKREGLLGTGARSNAYTDFHHTVFHVHAPLHNVSTGQPMVPEVGCLWLRRASFCTAIAAADCLMLC